MTGRLASTPPQVCPLALGLMGLSGCLAHWSRIQLVDLAPLPLACALLAASLLSAYAAKAALAPSAALLDASEPGTLSALSAWPAALQAVLVRLLNPFMPSVVQAMVLVCCTLSLAITGRFVGLCFRRGARPDPSWFPAMLLSGMTINTSTVAGPFWFKPFAVQLFWLLVLVYFPLKAAVVYRILLSRDRLAVSPNAGMAALMAPASFYTVVHLSGGKPGGDALGLVLFADSTVFLLVTLWLLYVRRASWIKVFHPSYVAFTFPTASTATAAVLAAERLPAVSGQLLWAWATLLMVGASAVIASVVVRFLWHLRGGALAPAAAPASKADKQK
eukprot:CAMPEP_0171227830 /NCGR_PEP_ID=MMETSP0790-20130122/38049_1 /TAXON_ID=2925 /ORGANISM="Alexandrium catenella, Strain OF101" /LENGTH=331 /DNA_ID=CAMNT_0011693955 /DNA_START=78 /DNA_END=1073 /DNA_ORIENTATION=+